MPDIVVPVDFSSHTDSALNYAAHLAKKMGARVHLLHFYILPMDYAGMSAQPLDGGFLQSTAYLVPLDELKASAEAGMKRCAEGFAQAHPNVSFKTETRISGDLAADINEYCQEVNPLLVVMGTHPVHGIENLLGSTTFSLIKQLHYPLIAIPEGYLTPAFDKIVLAADLHPLSAHTMTIIDEMMTLFGGSLEVVHVRTEAAETAGESGLQSTFAHLKPHFLTLVNEEVTAALQQHLQTSGGDILIVLPHHHNLWEKIFSRPHTKDIVSNMPVPVLCIPERE